jgi:phenylacetate-CoA ligase
MAKIAAADMNEGFEQAWAETFRYASERSPFYRETLGGHRSIPPLADIPTVDKGMLSARNLDFLCVPREKIVEIVTTSGTTGKPVLWMLTRADLERLGENERLSFECAGLSAHDTVLLAVGMDRCFIAGIAYWLGLRDIGCGMVRAGASSPAMVLEMIERTNPTAVVAVPSFLRLIAEKAKETGIDLKAGSVKKAICIGEQLERHRDRYRERVGRAGLFDLWGYGVRQFVVRM